MFTKILQLAPVAPFDFGQSLGFLGEFPPAAGEQTIADKQLTKVVSLAGSALLFQVGWNGDQERPLVDLQLWSEQPLDTARLRLAEDRVRCYLSLDDDLRPFYALAERDAAFAPVVRRLYGYHQVKFLTPFENAVWAVLTQRNPMPLARRAKQALVTQYGPALQLADTQHQAFPEAAALAGLDLDQIDHAIGNRQKAAYLLGLASAFASIDETWLRAAPYAEVETWLRAIKGMGPWSASFVLVRGLGRMEQPPTGESMLAAAAARVYGRSVSERELPELAAAYGAYQGYWAHYLRAAG